MAENNVYDDVALLQEQMADVQSTLSSLQTTVNNLPDISGLSNTVSTLSDDVAGLSDDVATLEGMAGRTAIAENTDLNDLTEGHYYISNYDICQTLSNRPDATGQTATIDVFKAGNTGQLIMIYQPCLKENSKRYIRSYYANGWGAWLTDDNNDTGWIDLPLNSGWTMNDYESEKPQYRKIGKVVYLRGLVNATSAAAGAVATLPLGFRPAGYFNRFVCSLNQEDTAVVNINANGLINDHQKGSKSRLFLSLNGISFPQVY